MKKDTIIILDTETTDASEKPWMIQLWYIVCDLNFKEIKRENMFFKNKVPIDFSAMAIHHITQKQLDEIVEHKDYSLEKQLDTIASDFKNAYLVAHNSPFDKNVLDCFWIETDIDAWIDSYNIAYWTYIEHDLKHNLQYLRYALDCKFDEIINPHDALSDVIVLKEVFKRIFADFCEEESACDPHKNILDRMVKQTIKWIILRTWTFWKYKDGTFAETFRQDRWYFEWMYNSKVKDGATQDAVFNTLKFYLWKK